jgi:hypothetical protein
MLIHLYSEPRARAVDFGELAAYVAQKLPQAKVDVRPPMVETHLQRTPEDLARLAKAFAGSKIRNPALPRMPFEPLYGEIDFERRRLSDPENLTFGLLYDGLALIRLFGELIPEEQSGPDDVNIVFTNQLVGTWEESDRRWHARVGVFSFPSIISTSGVVEAPAKPREYYLMRQQYSALGMVETAEVEFRKAYPGTFIDHDDSRMTEVLKGYVMQAVFFHVAGEEFCDDPDCRLFNAHWQSEMIHAQLDDEYEFCPQHEKMLTDLDVGEAFNGLPGRA